MENMPSTSSPSSHEEIEDAAVCEIVPSIANSRPSMDRPYDVFINHRGMDVKNTLASHIYYALESRGIRVFLDKDRMETGELIDAQIKDAIENASIYIAIFSKNYAGSSWCLNELCLMMEHPAKILAVFYDVEPCDLRWVDNKDGPYAKALKTHQEKRRYDSEILEKWKKALYDAAGRSGCELKKGFNGDEGALLKHIVNNVLMRVKRDPLDVAKYPVGLDEVAEDFEKRMLLRAGGNTEEDVKVVGIVGMGGAGKTTLAKHLFNIKRTDYGRSSFLFDVRSKCLTDLQSKLLKDLTDVYKPFDDTSEGIAALRSRLSNCKALVVLDDIDGLDQLEALLVVKDGLGYGSLILVTSRDKRLLRCSQIALLYDMRKLSKRHSQELFCSRAFGRPFPMEGFEELVESFVDACDGLPLSLKVFGALVCGNNIAYWKSQLEKISQRLERDIKNRLRVSYDALDIDDREMFLDVACFFISEHKDTVARILDGCQGNGLVCLNTLESKCLIEIDDRDLIRMHDQLRDMGRDIADEDSNKPRRLWRPRDVTDLQRRSRTTQVIRGIRSTAAPLYDEGIPPFLIRQTRQFTWLDCCKEALGMLCRPKFQISGLLAGEGALKLLVVEGDCLKGICRSASTDLVWLRWHNCPYRSLPLCLHSMENLRVLEILGGNIETPWHVFKGIPTQLRELRIMSSPVKFPKCIGQLTFLQKLVLCETGDNMTALPDELCRLRSLKHLELRFFGKLGLLPQNFGDLTNLQHLDLTCCENLQGLPDSFSRLLQLQYLCLRCCFALSLGQDALRNILTLEHVDFSCCHKLEVLPIQISSQSSLEKLYLRGTSLKELPNEIGDLRNLKVLELGSTCLPSLPTSMWNLSSLTSLTLYNCTNLKRLPQDDADDPTSSTVRHLRGGFEHMRDLEDLDVQCCALSEVIPYTSIVRKPEKEETVTVLDLRDSAGLLPKLKRFLLRQTEIASISIPENVCPSLTSLDVSHNTHLVEVEALPNALESLELRGCGALKRITGLSNLAKLLFLDIRECRELEELPNLEQLSSLEIFKATGCWELEEVPNVSQLTSLKTLDVDDCWKLKSLKGLEKLKRLEELTITADNGIIRNDIQFLQRLPPHSKLSSACLTRRAVPGVEKTVDTILGSFASPLSILKKSLFGRYRDFKVLDIESVNAMMICILFKASARGDSIVIACRPGIREFNPCYEVFGEEGEGISMRIYFHPSAFLTFVRANRAEQPCLECYPHGGMEMRKGWIATAREGEGQGKLLRVWNMLITRLYSDCSLYGTT